MTTMANCEKMIYIPWGEHSREQGGERREKKCERAIGGRKRKKRYRKVQKRNKNEKKEDEKKYKKKAKVRRRRRKKGRRKRIQVWDEGRFKNEKRKRQVEEKRESRRVTNMGKTCQFNCHNHHRWMVTKFLVEKKVNFKQKKWNERKKQSKMMRISSFVFFTSSRLYSS